MTSDIVIMFLRLELCTWYDQWHRHRVLKPSRQEPETTNISEQNGDHLRVNYALHCNSPRLESRVSTFVKKGFHK